MKPPTVPKELHKTCWNALKHFDDPRNASKCLWICPKTPLKLTCSPPDTSLKFTRKVVKPLIPPGTPLKSSRNSPYPAWNPLSLYKCSETSEILWNAIEMFWNASRRTLETSLELTWKPVKSYSSPGRLLKSPIKRQETPSKSSWTDLKLHWN